MLYLCHKGLFIYLYYRWHGTCGAAATGGAAVPKFLVHECMSLMQEDLYGLCLKRVGHILSTGSA